MVARAAGGSFWAEGGEWGWMLHWRAAGRLPMGRWAGTTPASVRGPGRTDCAPRHRSGRGRRCAGGSPGWAESSPWWTERKAPRRRRCRRNRSGRSGSRGATLWRTWGALSVEEAVARVLPGVVAVLVDQGVEQNAQGELVQRGANGTGLVIDADGYILTAEHLVQEGRPIEVILPSGERRRASVVATDAPFTDLAVLRVEGGGLTPVPLGSAAALRLGESVVAVGYVLLQETPSVTVGVVSHPNTTFLEGTVLQEHLIQTDAALNHGNSGGALITLQGEVVGLISAVVRRSEGGDTVEGVGFALRIDEILPIAERIVAEGRYPRPDLGVVREQTIIPEAAAEFGLAAEQGSFLIEITREGPLARAGLRPGDIIVSLNGIPISEEIPLLNVLSRLEPDRDMSVVYLSEDGEHQITVTPELYNR